MPTEIQWTDETWNPIVGCSIVSKGCTNCYAMRTAGARTKHTAKYQGLTQPSKAGPVWTGELRFWETALLAPLKWRTPRRVFVNSMGDLFHEDAPDEWIDRVFAVMALAPQHVFQVLTKRPERMRAYLQHQGRRTAVRLQTVVVGHEIGRDVAGEQWLAFPLPNVWLGTSCEDQATYDARKEHLRGTPGAVHFFSMEPLLGPIVADWLGDWVIAGGESGRSARPMHPDWARSLRDQCQAAGVPYFFKQWGEWGPDVGPPDNASDRIMEGRARCAWWDGHGWHFEESGYRADLERSVGEWAYRLGKKAAGRLLDGREWNEFPEQPLPIAGRSAA